MEKLNFDVLERILKNDPKAMQLLRDGLRMEIRKYAQKRRLNSEEADMFFAEVCGEVFTTYFNKKKQLSPEDFAAYWTSKDVGSFKKYFQKTANNHLKKFVKNLRSPYNYMNESNHAQVADDAKLPFEEITPDKRILILAQGMRQLDAKCRELIKDIHVYDLQMVDLAEDTGEKEGTVRARLSRCIKILIQWGELHGLTVKKGK